MKQDNLFTQADFLAGKPFRVMGCVLRYVENINAVVVVHPSGHESFMYVLLEHTPEGFVGCVANGVSYRYSFSVCSPLEALNA